MVLANPYLALVLTFAIALAFLRLMDAIAQRGWLSSHMSRKWIHIGTGPLFVLCWLLFPPLSISRYLAALVPLLITAQFALVGLGLWRDEAAVQAMSRSGDRRELLRGPLFYGLAFVALTVLFWKDSPIGIVALMFLCGGDGIADLLGRRLRSPRLPWNPQKTAAGSFGVFLGGLALSLLILAVYLHQGVFAGPVQAYAWPLLVLGVVAVAVESLPVSEIDNLTLPLVLSLIGYWVF